MLVLGLCGSLRRDSYNRQLLAAASGALPAGVEYDEWVGLAQLPPYNEDLDTQDAPAQVQDLRRTLGRADVILIATPEYNHSIPGQLKNAIDWASRPFPDNCLRGKPVAVIGASASMFGAVWAQAELRKVLTATGAHVIDEQLPVPSAYEAFGTGGELRDPALRSALAAIVQGLLGAARATLKRAA